MVKIENKEKGEKLREESAFEDRYGWVHPKVKKEFSLYDDRSP